MFIVSTSFDGPRMIQNQEIGRFETFELAEKFVRNHYALVCFEVDEDYPGEGCADFMTIAGVVGKVEPENFHAKKWKG